MSIFTTLSSDAQTRSCNYQPSQLVIANAPHHSSGVAFKQPIVHRKASCACGGGCPSCLTQSSTLKVSQPNDPAEIEADHVADRVMRMGMSKADSVNSPAVSSGPTVGDHSLTVYRKCNACVESDPDEQTVQRKALPTRSVSSQSEPHVDAVLTSGGQPLDRETLSFFEPRLGYDLSGIRVHNDSAAASSAELLDATAYTFGSHIVFGSGQFAPRTESGRHLLAHELAHMAQVGANGQLHRKKRGAAGGCGICMKSTEAGTIAHAEIELAFAASNPDIIGEYAVPVVAEGQAAPFIPEVDLSYDSSTSNEKIKHIGEIKPLDDAGEQAAIARKKLQDYAREIKANPALGYDEVVRMRDPAPSHPIPFFNPNKPPLCPPQVIYVKRTEPGIYQYYCEPPWSDLVRDPRCNCKKKDQDEEKQKEQVVQVPQTEEERKDETQKQPTEEAPTGTGESALPYVLPVTAVGVSAAVAAYLRKRAIEQAELRAAQLAWRRAVEAAAARRAAAAAGKGLAGKAVAKAAGYVQIAAAAALIVSYPERVEAKPGLGPSPIESLYKAMTTNGTPPSPEMKALIESDPVLKQLAEEAGGSGDGSKLQEEMARRTLQLIKDNPTAFTPEDLEFLTEYSKTAKSGQTLKTADELRKAIDVAKAGRAGDGSGGKSADAGTDAETPEAEVKKPPADAGTTGADKGDTPAEPETTPTSSDSPAVAALSDENKKKIKEAPQPVSQLFQEFITKQKLETKLDDAFVRLFFEIVPSDLTEQQSQTLISRLTPAPEATVDAVLESLKKGVEEIRKDAAQTSGGGTGGGTPPTQPAPPAIKTQEEIIAELKAIAMTYNFSRIPKNSYQISDVRSKITGTTISTNIYAKTGGGVGVVGHITGTVPAGTDPTQFRKGDVVVIEITSQSPLVDKDGKVHSELTLEKKLSIGI